MVDLIVEPDRPGVCFEYPTWAANYTALYAFPYWWADLWKYHCRYSAPFLGNLAMPVTPRQFEICKGRLLAAAEAQDIDCIRY